jgi:hypothetical protein
MGAKPSATCRLPAIWKSHRVAAAGLTARQASGLCVGVKSALYLAGAMGAFFLTSCVKTTLENRRDLYSPQVVNGPYTRMINDGIPRVKRTTVTTETTTTTVSGDYKGVVR